METNNRPHKSSCADYHSEISSPVLRVLQVNDQGVVFESREAFETGSTIELGFHVQYHVEADSAALPCSEFITGEGTVVASSLCASEGGHPIYEVTMLFLSISRRDRRALKVFTQMDGENRMLDAEPAASEPAEASWAPLCLN